jgi:hypothetical protein
VCIIKAGGRKGGQFDVDKSGDEDEDDDDEDDEDEVSKGTKRNLERVNSFKSSMESLKDKQSEQGRKLDETAGEISSSLASLVKSRYN